MKDILYLVILFIVLPVMMTGQEGLVDLYDEAIYLLEQGENKEAIDIFNQLIEENPAHYQALGNRGVAYLYLGDKRRAYEDLTIAVKNQATARFFYFRSLSREKANYKKVCEDLDNAIALEPSNARYYYDRGQLKFKLYRILKGEYPNQKLEWLEEDAGISLNPCPDFEEATILNDEYEKTLENCEFFKKQIH